jgi:phosphopantothenoylcysteine decarboxylase/phosphopantothenate--cysteine ligase
MTSGPESRNLLLLMSGSIACAKATTIISEWSKRGGSVRVVCTRSVSEFVGAASLQGLGAEQVFDNVFEKGHAMEHIALGQWADVVLAAPATSNLINKLTAGIADDAVTTVWQAAYGLNKPMIIAPAMNTRMWRYPATQASVELLKEWGVHVLPVGEGELACGETGEGRLLEPAEILQYLELSFGQAESANRKRILITAGGTREPIDSVRYIGNISSGRTASSLADKLSAAGYEVTWLGANDAIRPGSACQRQSFSSFKDLQSQLQKLLAAESFDVVIHAAAVSDFSVAAIEAEAGIQASAIGGKLASDGGLVLRLEKNPKLLDHLKEWSTNPDLKVIGFKLTDSEDSEERLKAVNRQFEHAKVDAVVHNDLSGITEDSHTFSLYYKKNVPVLCKNSAELANNINQMLKGML